MSAQLRKSIADPERWRMGSKSCEQSVCRDILFRTVRGALFDHAIGRQTGVSNLIQQCAVADAQSARRLLAIPVMILQNLQNDFSFELPHRLASQLLQRDLAESVLGLQSGQGRSDGVRFG